VLESFGIRRDPFRQAFIASVGDPWEDTPTHTTLSPATQLILERASFEAAPLADAEVRQRACPAGTDQPRPLPDRLGRPLWDHR